MTESLESLIQEWEGLGIVTAYDRPTGTWIFIALHDVSQGMAVGGCRMQVYAAPTDALRDAMRLAEGMTYKWAAAGLPFGGGKSVLAVPGPLAGDERTGLLRRFGRLVASLRGTYGTGEDLGTTPADMAVVAQETAHVGGYDPTTRHALDPGPYTALGVFSGLRAAAAHVWGNDDLSDRPVLVQGVGDVGAPLARLLARAGARILATDVDAERAAAVAEEVGGTVVPPEEAYNTTCDVYAPCAVGATLNSETIPQLTCDIVAGSANNQLDEPSDAKRLHEQGITYVPDYVVNAGGAIAFGLLWKGERDEATLRSRVEGIGEVVREILAEATARNESPMHAASRRAEAVLEGGTGGDGKGR
jgi:leucine dehydrogenase